MVGEARQGGNPPQRGQGFQTTRWSQVLRAAGGDSAESREALAQLCQDYWYPLYAYVRKRGHSAPDASDLTQSYFSLLIEKGYLRQVRPEAGRFRAFLLASLRNFLANEWDKATALKRGGGVRILSLDSAQAEERYLKEPSDLLTPEEVYERRWALTVVERTMDRLATEFAERGRKEHFDLIEPQLTGRRPKTPYREVAAQLGVSEEAVKAEVSRARRRYGQLLRTEIGETVSTEEEIDAEIRYLLHLVRE
jgi:RNA polymerase sigma factor (sigma-70 family)